MAAAIGDGDDDNSDSDDGDNADIPSSRPRHRRVGTSGEAPQPGEQENAGDDDDGLDGEDEEDEEETGPVDTHVDLQPGPLPCLPPAGLPQGGVLTEHIVRCLATAFPGRTRLARWDLAYSSRADGISLRTLFRAGSGRAPTLIAIRDSAGGVFGAFMCEPWRVAPRYYGTGESFVFTCVPSGGACPPSGVRIYKWSGRNAYFQLGTPDALAVGGGGAYALKVDDDLAKGMSGDCDTFASPCLATSPEFDILHVELWAFDGL
jgi:hypothetical protein